MVRNLPRPKVEQAGPQKTQLMNTLSVPFMEIPDISRQTDGYHRLTPPTWLRSGDFPPALILPISFQTLVQPTPASLPAPLTLSEVHGYTRPDGQPTASATQMREGLPPECGLSQNDPVAMLYAREKFLYPAFTGAGAAVAILFSSALQARRVTSMCSLA